jgi:hypothetical protein
VSTILYKTARSSTGIERLLSILSWLPRYDRSWLRYEFEPNPKKKQSFCQTAELGNVPATPTFLRYDLFD